MTITKKDVEYVAKLARLKMTDQELEGFTSQLDSILGYMDKLNKIDTKDIPATSHVLDVKNVSREDSSAPESLTNEEAMKMAPDKEPPFFKVPKVIE